MIYEIQDTSKVAHLFTGWEETLIYSCLQGIMGNIYVTDRDTPGSAAAFVGCFLFLAGEPDRELAAKKPDGFVIMVPQNAAWADVIEACFPDAKRVIRYAIKKDTKFDTDRLKKMAADLPPGYELHRIDEKIYDLCLKNPVTYDFVSSFKTKEAYLEKGLGIVALRDGEIAAGASSYSRYREGIEIEVDTREQDRRKHLATACCAALILECLERGLYPSWDAHNLSSVHLAEKLGYEFSHEYAAYEVSGEMRTH